MSEAKKLRPCFLALSLSFLSLFGLFYYKYVPLVKSFQMALVPVLILMISLTLINVRWGLLFFVFAFPLINNLPYFFGIGRDIPHAPTALVLFLAFFGGWLIRNSYSCPESGVDRSIHKPLVLLSYIIVVSGIITFFRYANFFPFLTDKIYELIVNMNGVRVGGAHMSGVFVLLNYLTGFLFFYILMSVIKSREFMKKVLITLSVSACIALVFSLIQRYFSITLGNTAFFAELDQINSTFKDPNSFGVFLSGFFPLLLGLAISSPKKGKIFFLFLIVFSLFVFPTVGSRSPLLAIFVSIVAFFLLLLLNLKKSIKRKFVYAVSFFFIITIVFLSFILFAKQSQLYKKLDWSLRSFGNTNSVYNLFTGKLDLWAVASKMILDFPATGIGSGAYIVELPNYVEQMGMEFRLTDSAENYFIQAGAELGLIGLILFIWVFYEIARQMWRSVKDAAGDNDRFILFGAISGIVGTVCVNFVFHSYIGAFEVNYFFWLLVALVFLITKMNKTTGSNFRLRRKFKALAIVLVITFGSIHLWHSTHVLSLESRTKEYGWNQNFGLYQQEKDESGVSFRWTKKSAGITLESVGTIVDIPIKASHPDIEINPVSVRVYSAGQCFENRRFVREITLDDHEWLDFKHVVPDDSEKKIHLIFETSRDWQPLKELGIPDSRWLAIALGDVRISSYPQK
jgi:O-antigen ligase